MKIVNDELIKKWEKLRLEAYKPTPDDVWTIGWGHTKTARPGQVITVEKAQELFEYDTDWVEEAIADLVKVELNQNQYDATASLVFNIGRTQFSNSTFLKRLNAKDWLGAAEALTWWNKQKGKTLRGLVRRREEEKSYFLEPYVETISEDESSSKPEESVQLKPLINSKEVVTGSTAVLGGLAALAGGLTPLSQVVLVGALSVALLAFGSFIIWNRVKARNEGAR